MVLQWCSLYDKNYLHSGVGVGYVSQQYDKLNTQYNDHLDNWAHNMVLANVLCQLTCEVCLSTYHRTMDFDRSCVTTQTSTLYDISKYCMVPIWSPPDGDVLLKMPYSEFVPPVRYIQRGRMTNVECTMIVMWILVLRQPLMLYTKITDFTRMIIHQLLNRITKMSQGSHKQKKFRFNNDRTSDYNNSDEEQSMIE